MTRRRKQGQFQYITADSVVTDIPPLMLADIPSLEYLDMCSDVLDEVTKHHLNFGVITRMNLSRYSREFETKLDFEKIIEVDTANKVTVFYNPTLNWSKNYWNYKITLVCHPKPSIIFEATTGPHVVGFQGDFYALDSAIVQIGSRATSDEVFAKSISIRHLKHNRNFTDDKTKNYYTVEGSTLEYKIYKTVSLASFFKQVSKKYPTEFVPPSIRGQSQLQMFYTVMVANAFSGLVIGWDWDKLEDLIKQTSVYKSLITHKLQLKDNFNSPEPGQVKSKIIHFSKDISAYNRNEKGMITIPCPRRDVSDSRAVFTVTELHIQDPLISKSSLEETCKGCQHLLQCLGNDFKNPPYAAKLFLSQTS